MSKRILILGATGRTGKHAIPLALSKVYEVIALVRDAAKLTVKSNHLVIVVGSPVNIDDICNPMKGCDAVLSLLVSLPNGVALSIRKIDRSRILERRIGR